MSRSVIVLEIEALSPILNFIFYEYPQITQITQNIRPATENVFHLLTASCFLSNLRNLRNLRMLLQKLQHRRIKVRCLFKLWYMSTFFNHQQSGVWNLLLEPLAIGEQSQTVLTTPHHQSRLLDRLHAVVEKVFTAN